MSLTSAAIELSTMLNERQLRVVFAESCTAGLVSATLAGVSGISQWHCGSAVTYQNDTKMQWLGVSERTIERVTEVSEQVARQMAVGVLEKTKQAHLSASITGHLGPNAPDGFDGLVYIGVARRAKTKPKPIAVHRLVLTQKSRKARQREAAEAVLTTVLGMIAAG